MMNKRITCLLTILFVSATVWGQDTDFGIWTEINASRKVTELLKAELSVSARTYQNSSKIEQLFGEAGLSYRIKDYLGLASYYRLVNGIENDSRYHFTHKFFFDLKGYLTAGDLDLSARVRMQITNRTYLENPTDDPLRYHARLKLTAQYDIPSFRFSPFISYETFTPVARGDGFEISKYRATVGSEIKISSKSSLEIGYLFEHDTRPDLINNNIISVSWNLKF